jgi:hypothetical protein
LWKHKSTHNSDRTKKSAKKLRPLEVVERILEMSVYIEKELQKSVNSS